MFLWGGEEWSVRRSKAKLLVGDSDSAGLRRALLLGAGAATVWAALAIVDHRNGNSGIFDLGLIEQALWTGLQGRDFYSSVLGHGYLGEHWALVLHVALVAYRAWTSTTALIVLQALALGCSAPAVWFLARASGLGQGAALVWIGIVLLHPTFTYIALWDVHPVVVAMPLLLGALAAAADEQWNLATLLTLATLAAHEELGLVVAALGFSWFLLHWQFLRGGLLVALGLGWFAAAFGIWMPARMGGDIAPLQHFAWLGSTVPEVLRHLVGHPIETLRQANSPAKLMMLAGMLLPFAGLPLLGGRVVVPILAPLLYCFLSTAPHQFDLRSPYMSLTLPFLVAGAIKAAGRCKPRHVPSPLRTVAAVIAVLASQFVFLILPPVAARNDLGTAVAWTPSPAVVELRRIGIPPGSEPVTASNALGAHLARRSDLCLFAPAGWPTDSTSATCAPRGLAAIAVPRPEPRSYYIDLDASDPWPFRERDAYLAAVRALLTRADLRLRHHGHGLLVLEPGARDAAAAEIVLDHLRQAPARPPRGFGLRRRVWSGR